MDDYSSKAKAFRHHSPDSPESDPADHHVDTHASDCASSSDQHSAHPTHGAKQRRKGKISSARHCTSNREQEHKSRIASSHAEKALSRGHSRQAAHHRRLSKIAHRRKSLHREGSSAEMHGSNHALTHAAQPLETQHHQHACVWQPNNRPHAHPQIFYRGIGYCSLSEAALSMLLEYFIPGFDVVLGKTFQVPIGEGRSVDFCINGVMIEYHQIRFFPSRGKCGDFKSEEEFREYRRLQQRVRGNPSKKALLERIMHQRLSANYFERRRALLDRSAYFSGAELLVATSREEFFDLVIRRFALVELPTRAQFTAMFWQMVKVIAASNEGSKKRKSA